MVLASDGDSRQFSAPAEPGLSPAQRRAYGRVRPWTAQSRCCILGLVAVEAARILALEVEGRFGSSPPLLLHGSVSLLDLAQCCVWLPVLLPGCSSLQRYVERRLLGLVVTFNWLATLARGFAVMFQLWDGGFFSLRPVYLRLLLQRADRFFTCWDLLMMASTWLSAALTLCLWRVYRTMREERVYPVSLSAAERRFDRVSTLELFCEVEDTIPLKECCQTPRGDAFQEVEVASAQQPSVGMAIPLQAHAE